MERGLNSLQIFLVVVKWAIGTALTITTHQIRLNTYGFLETDYNRETDNLNSELQMN